MYLYDMLPDLVRNALDEEGPATYVLRIAGKTEHTHPIILEFD